MLVVTTYLWHDEEARKKAGHDYEFDHDHVRLWKRSVDRNLSIPHRTICVTDDDIEGVETVPLDWRKHVSGTVFLRLMQHNPEFGASIGATRILNLDLDMVVTGSLDALASRDEDFIIFKNPNFPAPRRSIFQSSIQSFVPGARPELWNDFGPETTPRWINWRFGGKEQAWIAERLPWTEATFDERDGVYGAGRLGGEGVYTELPDNACLVTFPGNRTPWQADVQARHPWIAEHCR